MTINMVEEVSNDTVSPLQYTYDMDPEELQAFQDQEVSDNVSECKSDLDGLWMISFCGTM